MFAAASRAAVEQAGRFSWEASARALVDLATEIASRRSRRA